MSKIPILIRKWGCHKKSASLLGSFSLFVWMWIFSLLSATVIAWVAPSFPVYHDAFPSFLSIFSIICLHHAAIFLILPPNKEKLKRTKLICNQLESLAAKRATGEAFHSSLLPSSQPNYHSRLPHTHTTQIARQHSQHKWENAKRNLKISAWNINKCVYEKYEMWAPELIPSFCVREKFQWIGGVTRREKHFLLLPHILCELACVSVWVKDECGATTFFSWTRHAYQENDIHLLGYIFCIKQLRLRRIEVWAKYFSHLWAQDTEAISRIQCSSMRMRVCVCVCGCFLYYHYDTQNILCIIHFQAV